MTLSAGIDLGSTTIKLALMQDGQIIRRELESSSANPQRAAISLLKAVPKECPVLATGYGRDLLELEHNIPTITEIKAHAAGARFLFPECAAVVDIGGQDVKVIKLDTNGRVNKFEMNDRCAAGTGKFLEVMAQRLGYTLDEFQRASGHGKENVTINSMCTVFAESEVVGLLNRGFSREDIGRALHRSIARRIAAMFGRACNGDESHILATGGGSLNHCLVAMLGEHIKLPIQTSEQAQFAGAIGCAICGTAATAAR